jgi:PAS domain S-box-containing protein
MTGSLLKLELEQSLSGESEAREGQREERFRSLFEDAPVAYHEIDSEGIVRRVNTAECQMLGLEASQILGKPVWNLVAPEQRQLSRDSVRRKLTGQEPLAPLQRRYLLPGGIRIVVEIHENLIRDAHGAIVGIRSVLLDVTERDRAENELRRKSVELAAAKSELVSQLGHDLNELIRTTALLMDTLLTPEQRDYAAAARKSAEALRSAIDAIHLRDKAL